jgi:hypothetical protein
MRGQKLGEGSMRASRVLTLKWYHFWAIVPKFVTVSPISTEEVRLNTVRCR